jgi:hypothetical protein
MQLKLCRADHKLVRFVQLTLNMHGLISNPAKDTRTNPSLDAELGEIQTFREGIFCNRPFRNSFFSLSAFGLQGGSTGGTRSINLQET